MKNPSTTKALSIAIKAAYAAGKVMRANWNKPKRVKVMDAHDIKLELDVRCQKIIQKILFAAFPEIPLLGEEGDSGDVNTAYRWVVDPIDGTVNYFYGLPHACTSIALQVQSPKSKVQSRKPHPSAAIHPPSSYQTVLGVIFDPFACELWTATLGGKTRLNGRVVRASRHSKIGESIIAMGFSKSRSNLEKSKPYLNQILLRARKVRLMGSAALELAYVACGRLDAYIERTINLWDIAAGGLMVECSGGEFWIEPMPDGRFRMCAHNGLLRKKLQVGKLMK